MMKREILRLKEWNYFQDLGWDGVTTLLKWGYGPDLSAFWIRPGVIDPGVYNMGPLRVEPSANALIF